MILAGDIGGTNTRLAIFDDQNRMVGKSHKFKTGNGLSLESQCEQVLRTAKNNRPARACLAIAGPVIDGVCRSTNIGRNFVSEEIKKTVGLDSLELINDLVANAAGIELLDRTEVVTVMRGENHTGSRAILSPGTGLGEGALIWNGKHHRPIPSEGGHTRFAPTNDLEQELLDYLMPFCPTVTYENVCSGKGIEPLFRFFVDRGSQVAPAFMKKIDREQDVKKRAAYISDAAIAKSQPAAIDAMHLFVSVLGVEASNLVLTFFATGGVYLGGGISPRILPLIKSPVFKKAFLSHRDLGDLLNRIPVRVILNTNTALEGAALYGRRFYN